jgi:TetR/AcrR family transcriptional regulator, mexJK operon transcriptional repressor
MDRMTLLEPTTTDTSAALRPKAAQILEAAAVVFCEQGYGATSVDAIAKRAGVSKATLYAHFNSKDELFAAVVGTACRRFSEGIAASDLDRLPVKEALRELARSFVTLILTPRAMAIRRVVIAEAPRFPELGRIFYESGPKIVRRQLAGYLARAALRRQLDVSDPEIAAQHFLEMSKGSLDMCRLLSVPDEAPHDVEQIIDSAVEVFWRAYKPQDQEAGTA